MDDKSVRILNRVVQYTKDGLVYEADQRHGEIIARELGLQANSKSVNTPGVSSKVLDKKGAEDWEENEFRSIAARANYLVQDRPDIQYAVKEACKHMSKPEMEDWGV